jgi:hypothetical protein
MNADRAMTASTLFMSKSLEMVVRAGAMIVDTIMRLKPVADKTSVTVHFLELDQHLLTISIRSPCTTGWIAIQLTWDSQHRMAQ